MPLCIWWCSVPPGCLHVVCTISPLVAHAGPRRAESMKVCLILSGDPRMKISQRKSHYRNRLSSGIPCNARFGGVVSWAACVFSSVRTGTDAKKRATEAGSPSPKPPLIPTRCRSPTNCALAFGADLSTVYAVGKNGSLGYLMAMGSPTLRPRAPMRLLDPATTLDAELDDNATSSPSIGLENDVLTRMPLFPIPPAFPPKGLCAADLTTTILIKLTT